MFDYVVHGFHTLSAIKKAEILSYRELWDKVLSNGCLICVSLKVLYVKKFETALNYNNVTTLIVTLNEAILACA